MNANQLHQHTFYQRRGHLRPSSFVTQHIRLEGSGPEKIVLLIGPGRSYTTAWLLWFISQFQVPGAYQILKQRLRYGLAAGDFRLPAVPLFAMKETWSADFPLECSFDPVDILIRAGVSPEKIVCLIILREPIPTYASWWYFTQRTRPSLLALAMRTAISLYHQYQNTPVTIIPIAASLMVGRELKVLNKVHTLAGLSLANSLDFNIPAIFSYLILGEAASTDHFSATVAPVLTQTGFRINGNSNSTKVSLVPKRHLELVEQLCLPPYAQFVELSQKILTL